MGNRPVQFVTSGYARGRSDQALPSLPQIDEFPIVARSTVTDPDSPLVSGGMRTDRSSWYCR